MTLKNSILELVYWKYHHQLALWRSQRRSQDRSQEVLQARNRDPHEEIHHRVGQEEPHWSFYWYVSHLIYMYQTYQDQTWERANEKWVGWRMPTLSLQVIETSMPWDVWRARPSARVVFKAELNLPVWECFMLCERSSRIQHSVMETIYLLVSRVRHSQCRVSVPLATMPPNSWLNMAPSW